jgi:glycerol-3-phosphate acyltransferase PlsY
VALAIAFAALCGYLLGSIPFGLLISKRVGGRDLREFGSGKTGFTNSLRVLGLKRSAPVFAGDLLKGSAAALLPLLYTDEPWARAIGGLAAVAGHVWPVFAGFRGGRGVLTGAGVLLALNPIASLCLVPVALVVIAITRYVSLASITACTLAGPMFIAFAAAGYSEWAYAFTACVGGLTIVVLHHDNIARLRAGTERKLGRGGERRSEASPAP